MSSIRKTPVNTLEKILHAQLEARFAQETHNALTTQKAELVLSLLTKIIGSRVASCATDTSKQEKARSGDTKKGSA